MISTFFIIFFPLLKVFLGILPLLPIEPSIHFNKASVNKVV